MVETYGVTDPRRLKDATEPSVFDRMLAIIDANSELCQSHKSDLTIHDLAWMQRYPTLDFVWVPYHYGTHITADRKILKQIADDFPGARFFIVAGSTINEATFEQARISL